MTRIASTRGAPHTIRVDNWSRVHLESARSVGLTERRDARLQPTWQADRQCVVRLVQWSDECLNAHWFLSLADARAKTRRSGGSTPRICCSSDATIGALSRNKRI